MRVRLTTHLVYNVEQLASCRDWLSSLFLAPPSASPGPAQSTSPSHTDQLTIAEPTREPLKTDQSYSVLSSELTISYRLFSATVRSNNSAVGGRIRVQIGAVFADSGVRSSLL